MKPKLVLLIMGFIFALVACDRDPEQLIEYPQCKDSGDPNRCIHRVQQEAKREEFQKEMREFSHHILVSYGETSNTFVEFNNLKHCQNAIERAKVAKSKFHMECVPK